MNNIYHRCKKCAYKSIRTDNLDRHIKTHLKERVQCECGQYMAKTSLNQRHRLSAKHRNAMNSKGTLNDKTSAPFPPNRSPNSLSALSVNNNDDASKSNDANSFEELYVNVETTIKIKTTPDGQLIVEQTPIKIAGMDFVIVPSHLLHEN